jgi:hypothetical protein
MLSSLKLTIVLGLKIPRFVRQCSQTIRTICLPEKDLEALKSGFGAVEKGFPERLYQLYFNRRPVVVKHILKTYAIIDSNKSYKLRTNPDKIGGESRL